MTIISTSIISIVFQAKFAERVNGSVLDGEIVDVPKLVQDI